MLEKKSHLSSKNFFLCQKFPKNFPDALLEYPKSTNAWPSNFGLFCILVIFETLINVLISKICEYISGS